MNYLCTLRTLRIIVIQLVQTGRMGKIVHRTAAETVIKVCRVTGLLESVQMDAIVLGRGRHVSKVNTTPMPYITCILI